MKKKNHILSRKFVIYVKKISTDDRKVRDHSDYSGKYRGDAHNNCNLNYKKSKEILVVFHNCCSIYDYHFIIKELAKEFKAHFEWLAENTEKSITFSVPFKKPIKIY